MIGKCKHCRLANDSHTSTCVVTARRELRKIEALEKLVINLGRIVDLLEEKMSNNKDNAYKIAIHYSAKSGRIVCNTNRGKLKSSYNPSEVTCCHCRKIIDRVELAV